MKFENLKMMATLLLAAVSAFAQTPASVMEKSSAWFCDSKGWELELARLQDFLDRNAEGQR